MKRILVVGLVGLAVALGGCSGGGVSAAEPPFTVVPGAFLGRAGDSKVFLAVVPGAGSIRVYACDGEDLAHATVDQWFTGAFDGTGPVTLAAGALELTVRAVAAGFAGDFVLGDGTSLPFTATRPVDERSALLDAEVKDPTTGKITRDGNVIVIGNEQRGAMVPTRPPKCRALLVSGPNGTSQYVIVC